MGYLINPANCLNLSATSFDSSTISEEQTMDSGVLAGPVTITATQTITGTLVVV